MAPIKPEAALDKAKKMVNIAKIDSAIEILIECMKAQKKQKSWTKIHEDLMMLLAELCVNSRKSLQFKEVIHQYKNMTAQVNPKSLEDVVRAYLNLARSRTELARTESQVVPDIDDLENLEAPESLILRVVNAEVEQERQDRTVLTPWLKFLWESYRQCLELLRNNSRFEKMYHEIVNDAAEFCRKYDRKAEFKKLCEILRSHMTKLQNNLSIMPNNQQMMNITADSWGYHHETRLKLLDQAMNFELYSEAYKAVEDLWNLLNTSTAPVKSRITANYYQKTSRVFFESGLSYLFHAAALHRYFFFSKENKKNLLQNEIESLATQMIIATLAIPLPFIRETIDPLLESGEITDAIKLKRLSQLLNLPTPPTRASLINDIYTNRIHELVNPKLRKLFQLIEFDFKPLSMAKEAEPVLEWLEEHPNFSQYSKLIKDAIASKILIQIGKVYKSIKLEQLEKLCPFVSKLELMCIITNLIRNLELPIQIDYVESILRFDVFTDLGISQRNDTELVSEDVNSMSSLSRQINRFAIAMYEVVDFIGEANQGKDAVLEWIRTSYLRTIDESHAQMMIRKNKIETRKEEIEQIEEEQTMSMNEHIRNQEEKRRKEENSKLKEERELQQMKQMLQNKEKGEKKMLEVRINYLNSSEAGKEILKMYTPEQLEKMTDVDIAKIQCETRAQMKQEEQSRLKKLEQKLDYFQRALRLEEIPLIEKAQLEAYENAKQIHAQFEEERKRKAYEMYQARLANRKSCIEIKDDIEKYVGSLNEQYDKEYSKKLHEYESVCNEIKRDYREKRMAKLLEELAAKKAETAKIEAEVKREPEVVQEIKSKYVPPHLRNKQDGKSSRPTNPMLDPKKNSPKPRQNVDENGWKTAHRK